MTRRTLLRTGAGLPALLALPSLTRVLRAAEYDLVIRNGHVIDPAQKIDRLADVAIRAGRVESIRPNIRAEAAAESLDAKGHLVVPGLIDIHLHARDATLLPPEILSTGVTSMVDAGSRGADNIGQILEIARGAPNRMRILINISRLGNNPNPDPARRGEFLDGIELADVAKARAAIEQNRQWIVGMKARLSRNIAANHDLEVLRLAVEAATPSGIPIMIHMGDTASPLPEILKLLRSGDIVSHLYAPPPHGIQDDAGRILAEVRAARRRGIRFDFGNGRNEHWTWAVAASALAQGFPPDTISTDLEVVGRTEQVFDLPTVMSKFLVLGMPLNQVIACVTSNAARSFREFHDYGNLRKGSVADITILELTKGTFDFVDNYKGTRTGTRKLVTRAVLVAGKRVA
jgi:dihydroorotase